jgi:hypothetical protein
VNARVAYANNVAQPECESNQLEVKLQPFIGDHRHHVKPVECTRTNVDLEDEDGHHAEWSAEEAHGVVDEEEFEFEAEFGTVDGVEEDGFLPAVALFHEV